MKRHGQYTFATLLVFISIHFACNSPSQKEVQKKNGIASIDPLPSWSDGAAKKAIINYVKMVTDTAGGNFIPVPDRIATFDNDGTLWSEKPIYFQFFFALDRLKVIAADHPEWKNKQPYKAVLDNDMSTLMKQGEKGLLQIVMATHAGISTDEFESIVKQWLSTAKHPTKGRRYTELVYQPMIELIRYLQANQFKTFIVSGGGIEFMRPWVEQVYGIPKDQVVGSSVKTVFDYNNGHPVLKRLAAVDFIDDKEGKPVGINKFIGRKPVFACGNSDGDLQMLQWTASNSLKNLELYIHHTDSTREWSYDRQSAIGTLDKGLDEAQAKNWLLVDMKNDWKIIYPYEK
ncbi:HAD family hydrolase [Pinibacter aurantiacus]|uniref:Haloacid dehalogenase-like hydrolase n=1 Tax=Pinibacter aurantiacus TaxID=2851599 RepID=A0A9E2SC72_9BACT|nr:HAD family hydrolase [Pinibacter aurantiacus]MBV4358824.1 haloacid dehalogenase-like hydrolase [Pinibacter aurantiacus]